MDHLIRPLFTIESNAVMVNVAQFDTQQKCSPDIVVLLDVDLVKHHVFFFGVDVSLHFHGDMPWQNRQQQAFLKIDERECVCERKKNAIQFFSLKIKYPFFM